jgi:hypothetical protein
MEQLLLINPSKRRKTARKGRSAAQKAATRKLVAFNKARRAPATKRTLKRRAKARAHPVAGYFPNPSPARRRRRTSVASVKRAVSRRKYKRNPSSRTDVMAMLIKGLQGGAGAVAVNTVYAKLPLPAMMKSGNMTFVGRAALAIALGVFGRKILPGNTAARMAEGSLAVTAHDAIVMLAGSMAPNLGLAGVGYYAGGQQLVDYPAGNQASQLAEYVNTPGMGEYVNMGEYVGMSEY